MAGAIGGGGRSMASTSPYNRNFGATASSNTINAPAVQAPAPVQQMPSFSPQMFAPQQQAMPAVQPPAPMQQQLQIPQQQTYQPYNPAPINYQAPGAGQLGTSLGRMGEVAEGFLDPNSEYYKRLLAGMRQQIGKNAAAQQRAAALRAAYSGLGGGRGAEMMQTQADIGRAGLEAAGSAGADLRLRAPQMGMQALQSTFAPQLGVQQLQEQGRQFGAGLEQQQRQMGEQSRQFGAGLGEQGRQFGVGAGLQAQGQAQQAAIQQWQMQEQQRLAEQAQQQAMMQMMASMF